MAGCKSSLGKVLLHTAFGSNPDPNPAKCLGMSLTLSFEGTTHVIKVKHIPKWFPEPGPLYRIFKGGGEGGG